MKIKNLHDWQLSVADAKQIQNKLAGEVSRRSEPIEPRFVCGVDISAPDSAGIARSAAVVMSYPELEIAEIETAEGKLNFPYIPGLLSFREVPLVWVALQQLSIEPDLIMVDGHGIAHPRRFGIASHLGLLLDIPTLGCAKSRLCGTHSSVPSAAGGFSELMDDGEIIGAVLRSKVGVRPIYISIGHRIDLSTAIQWVMNCCHNYRLPEPSRLAHLAAGSKYTTIRASYT